MWNLDRLLSVVQPKATTRRNLVSIVTEEVHGGTALINYWNEALEALPSVARFPS